jgi:hypothetical protein
MPAPRFSFSQAWIAMLDPLICRLTRLLAAGDYPVETEVKRRWIDMSREAASCDDPDRADDLLEKITALIREEKRRLGTPTLS